MKFRKLKANEIECRVGTINSKGLSLLLYKDARCDMKILDEIVGMEYWKRDHKEIKNVVYCGVAIYCQVRDGVYEWVTKWDAGSESYTEKEKGEASDSFKRACFNWGIGRELYTSPFIWINPNKEKEIYQTNSNKYVTKSRFVVDEIDYKEDAISYLVIKDQDGTVRFRYGNKVPSDELVKQLLDLGVSTEDLYKWFDHYKVKYEEYETLADIAKKLQPKDIEFIIQRFEKRR